MRAVSHAHTHKRIETRSYRWSRTAITRIIIIIITGNDEDDPPESTKAYTQKGPTGGTTSPK